jgi:hypothetical protein
MMFLSSCSIPLEYFSSGNPTFVPLPTRTETPVLETATPEPTRYTPDYPDPNPDLPLFTVHIQAIRVADDNGLRRAQIEIEKVIPWIEEANRVYAGSGIRFLFDPAEDFSDIQSTLINSMMGVEDADWDQAMTAADSVASKYPGKIVVYFRYGPDSLPTGSGFSWYDYNFVAMPGFDTDVCGYQNIGMLAHEIGHYLGLPHTFNAIYSDIPEAESAFEKSGYSAAIFDGDGLSDTLPDPYIDDSKIQCGTQGTVTLKGVELPIPRTNIMSYYEVRDGLSPMQTTRARYTLAMRYRNAMAMPTNADIPDPIQFEELKVIRSYWETLSTQDMKPYGTHQFGGGKQLFINSAYLSDLIFELKIDKDAIYNIVLYATFAPDYGIFELYIDGILVTDTVDLYAPFVIPSGPVGLGPYLLTAGEHELRIVVKGKNANSSNYYLGLDALSLREVKQ